MRTHKRIELALLPAPMPYALELAECPGCRNTGAAVIGRLGRRLVFLCDRCNVRFHRGSPASGYQSALG
jgi:hypothetical protein